jgi:glycosyltransferase involved in cell wall biosynthesis
MPGSAPSPPRPVVVQLVGSFALGGSERQALQLTRLLAADGRYDVHLACLDPSGPLRAEADGFLPAAIESFPLTSFYDARAVIQWSRFVRYLRRLRAAIVQTHDFYTNVFGMIGAWLARVPVRIAARRETEGTRTPAQLRVELLAYRLAHSIVANAGAVAGQLSRQGASSSKIVTIHNGLDLARRSLPAGFDPSAIRRSLGLPENSPLVTLVANMNFELKDQGTFLRAAALVLEQAPGTAFALAGTGRLESSWKRLAAELGISAQVHFLGACNRVPELLAASTIGVLSSWAEGFSNSILEYMAAGLPVVATDAGGAREAVLEGQTGYIVAPRHPQALAARLLELLASPALTRRLGEAGRRRVASEFSCQAQLSRTLVLFEAQLRRAGLTTATTASR